ncbi:glycoside hydrolase family 2 TIM barrel-domain containing protein [Pseudoxanthomonas sacheonensis]|uniref:Beta-galactosidase n=1 Tax=Pseudoxanthomonas sacheonensis TaxID=443615 RepID=A0ABU1RX01_9GAMM|nr:glycoside hydrolase family 2 TIM barrel-domain containing protein [Pseudoxanthomonas sacheonensis]MDR6842659.1 beta-galactosidase [Pseudoxanthomonas sacheonensis]
MRTTAAKQRRLAAALLMAMSASPAWAEVRNLSQDWLFHAGEVTGAERSTFEDQTWQRVTVPHDFSIMDRADRSGPDRSAPFDSDAISGQDSGYLPGGTGWYRRHLTLTPTEASRIVRLNFEAVYMDADLWVNGEHLKKHRYGYTAFSVDLTGKVRAGSNTIVVRVDHADPSSRWYAGSGLIRPVALELLDPVHIEPESVFVSTPVATENRGVVSVSAAIANRSNKAQSAEWVTRIVAASGETVAEARQTQTVPAEARAEGSQELILTQPRLWSPDSPNLYTLVQEIRIDGATVDERRTRFGIRTISLDAANGLRINGQRVLLRGGNIHHDNYMIGAAGAADADARKVALMKAAGYNALRSAHNPASQATLDAADELGMLVIDEAFDSWNKSKKPQDYSRFFAEDWPRAIDSLVVSGRNHPSVLFWSIGNEIPEDGTPEGVETGRKLAERVRELDPTRPVTQGINADPPKSTNQAVVLDVVGYNYHAHLFAKEHERLPKLTMYTSESTSKDLFSYWRAVESMPWVIGDFVWTAVDYLGESGIGWMGYSQDWQKLGPYPWHLAYCGEIDATGRMRPAAYYRQVVWKTGASPISAFVRQPKGTEDLPDRHLYPITPPHLDWSLDDVHPSWTWPGQEGQRQEVVIYSEFPEAELFLNGKSLGRKPIGEDSEYKAVYQVPYAPGRLLAVGYRDGREAGRWELRTAGQPTAAVATADRSQLTANGEDLVYVAVELHDADGTPIYAGDDDRQIRVRVRGAGTLAGIGNGNPIDVSSFQSGQRKTFHGRVVAVVRAGTQAGPIVVDIEAEGLPSRQVRLNAVAPQSF